MKKPSTQNLNLIPNPVELQSICKSIATLEAIICPEWEFRYYSYQKKWSENEACFEMRNGEGDQMLILFSNEGICINGFAHENEVLLKKAIGNLPKGFEGFIFGEPVKSIGTTFCIWQTISSKKWVTGAIDCSKNDYNDGSSDLLELLDGNPSNYKEWAEEYYEEEFEEHELKLELVEKIFDNTVVFKELVKSINPELKDFEKLKMDLDEIGYQHLL